MSRSGSRANLNLGGAKAAQKNRTNTRVALVGLAVAVLCGGFISPVSAGAVPLVSDITLEGADGTVLSDSIDAAIEEYGAQSVAAVLDALAANAAKGTDVGFPGLESESAADTSILLEEAQVAVLVGDEIPAVLGEVEIAPVDPGHEVVPSTQSSGPVMQLASSIRKLAPVLPMVSAPVGTTPSQYLSYGGAISNNRAWQWDAGFNVYRCNTTCTLTDRRTLRTTITPYQNRVRIEQQTTYSPNNSGIGTPQITGKVYIPSAPARGSNTVNVGTAFTTWYIETPKLWTTGTKIIVGIEQRADSRTGEQVGLYRTLTATCFPTPKSYCAWFV